eukprot:501517_1
MAVQTEKEPLQRVVAIGLFLLVLVVITLCIYWLFRFWRIREDRAYKQYTKIRRVMYMILSYILILPCILQYMISTIYFYFDENQYEFDYYDGTPIYYSFHIDKTFHYLFWTCFWCFLQLKLLKTFMIRYDYEYAKEMSNIKWKDCLGLKTIERTSFFIRYRRYLGNTNTMFMLHIIILFLVIGIQALVRE